MMRWVRALGGVVGIGILMASSMVMGQETEESRLEPTIESLQRHVFDLELRVAEIESTLTGAPGFTPVPTVASTGGTTSVWGRVEVPTAQSLGESCTDGGLYAGAPVTLADPNGQRLSQGRLGGGTVMGRADEWASSQLVCVYTFDFDGVPAFDTYELQLPGFWTVISGYAFLPHGVVVFIDMPLP